MVRQAHQNGKETKPLILSLSKDERDKRRLISSITMASDSL